MSKDHSSSDDASHSSSKKTSVLDSLKSAGGSFRRFVTHSSLTEDQKTSLNNALGQVGGKKQAELEKYRDAKARYDVIRGMEADLAMKEAFSPMSGRKPDIDSKAKAADSGIDILDDSGKVISETQRRLNNLGALEKEIKEMEKNNPLIKKELEYAQRHGQVDKAKKPEVAQGSKKTVMDSIKRTLGVSTDHRQPSSRVSGRSL